MVNSFLKQYQVTLCVLKMIEWREVWTSSCWPEVASSLTDRAAAAGLCLILTMEALVLVRSLRYLQNMIYLIYASFWLTTLRHLETLRMILTINFPYLTQYTTAEQTNCVWCNFMVVEQVNLFLATNATISEINFAQMGEARAANHIHYSTSQPHHKIGSTQIIQNT